MATTGASLSSYRSVLQTRPRHGRNGPPWHRRAPPGTPPPPRAALACEGDGGADSLQTVCRRTPARRTVAVDTRVSRLVTALVTRERRPGARAATPRRPRHWTCFAIHYQCGGTVSWGRCPGDGVGDRARAGGVLRQALRVLASTPLAPPRSLRSPTSETESASSRWNRTVGQRPVCRRSKLGALFNLPSR